MVHNTHLVLWRVTPLWAVRLAARQGQLLPVPAWGFVADRDLDRSVLFLRPVSWFFSGGRVMLLCVFPSEGGLSEDAWRTQAD